MKKRTLLLLASAVLATGVLTDDMTVQARTIQGVNGAIVRQLPRANTDAYKKIMTKYSTPDKRFEKQAALFDYYDRNHRYIEADEAFNELIGMIKDLDGKAKDKEIAKWTPFIEEGVNEQPSNARRHYQKSIWERNFGSNEKAFSDLKIALALDPQNINYRAEYAQFALDNNDYDKAIEIYKALKKGYPHDVDYRIALAKAYSQAGQYDKAIHEYRVASAFEPSNNETIVALNETVNSYYSEMGGQNFYDPMRTVATNQNQVNVSPSMSGGTRQVSPTMMAMSASGSRTVEQEQPQQNQYQPVQNTKQITVSQTSAPQQVSAPPSKKMPNVKEATQRRNLQYTHSANNANYRPQPAPRTSSNKRILVTYVNGRKVIRIVNVNTENDSMNAVQNASATFNNQLENSNSSYEEQAVSRQQRSNKVEFAPSETENTQPTQQVSSYTSGARYQTTDTTPKTGEIGTRTTLEGDPSVKSLTNSQGRRPVMYVSYQNGKRVIKMVNPNSSALSSSPVASSSATTQTTQTMTSQPTQKVEKSNDKKVKNDKKSKKQKDNKKAESKPITTTQENTDMYIKANELLTQEDYQGTIQVLEGVNPPTLRSLTIIASCYCALGQPQKAIEYYNTADSMSPNNTQILYSLGYLYYTSGDIQQAKKYVDAAIAADPQNTNAQQLKQHLSHQDSNEVMNQAVTYMNNGEYANAKKLMEKVVTANPNDFQAYYYLGHIAYATEKYEDSTRNFMMAIKNNPNYALSYYSLGLAYDKLKEFNRSQLAYEQFLKMELDENKYTQYAKTRVATIQSKK